MLSLSRRGYDATYIINHAPLFLFPQKINIVLQNCPSKIILPQITVPTACNFLSRYLTVAEATNLECQRANYYCERSLQEHDMLQYRPSMVAASSLYMSLLHSNQGDPWVSFVLISYVMFSISLLVDSYKNLQPPQMQRFVGLTVEQLLPCAHMMVRFLHAEPVTNSKRYLVSCKKKFTHDKVYFNQLSLMHHYV